MTACSSWVSVSGDDPATSASRLADLLAATPTAGAASPSCPGDADQQHRAGLAPGHGRGDDADATFDLATAQYSVTAESGARADGQRLAEALGLPGEFFAHVAGAGSTDQRTARAMNRALFPATIGYWMETMVSPVFADDTVARTRSFMHDNVVASGPVPAIRIGNQPYGILPTTAVGRIGWFAEHPRISVTGFDLTGEAAYLRQLYALIRARARRLVGAAGRRSRT